MMVLGSKLPFLDLQIWVASLKTLTYFTNNLKKVDHCHKHVFMEMLQNGE